MIQITDVLGRVRDVKHTWPDGSWDARSAFRHRMEALRTAFAPTCNFLRSHFQHLENSSEIGLTYFEPCRYLNQQGDTKMLHSLQQIERTGQASFNETLRLMSDGLIEVEGGGYYRLTPAGETELARLLLLDRAKKDKRNAAARGRSAALRGVGLKRTADGWA